MIKRYGATAWRVGVSGDGRLFSLGVRTERGREVEVVLGTADASALVADLLADLAAAYRALPPAGFGPGAGADHPRSRPSRQLGVEIRTIDGAPALVADFGGAVVKIAIDPEALRAQLDRLEGRA
jgi:hypothetical protein